MFHAIIFSLGLSIGTSPQSVDRPKAQCLGLYLVLAILGTMATSSGARGRQE